MTPALVFATMGTDARIEVKAGEVAETDARALIACAADWDREFSLYREDSTLSRIADGSLRLADASERVRDAYAESLAWSSRTSGAFTPHRPDGVLDLSGIVKALAIAELGRLLTAAGHHDWAVEIGGDIQSSGAGWRSAIVDPESSNSRLGAIDLTAERSAIATSGSAERGDHIWRWGSERPFRQVTVRAADIVTADVLATAIVAGGHALLDEVTSRWSVDVLAVDADGVLWATAGMREQ